MPGALPGAGAGGGGGGGDVDVSNSSAHNEIGSLPESPEEVKVFNLVDGGVPEGAKEVFVHVFVTTHGEEKFQRGYYEISTKQLGEPDFTQYMNVATGQGMMAVNSANMWFPAGTSQLTVKLVHSNDSKKSIAGRTQDTD